MEIWFNKKNNGIKTYKSRVIGLRFFPQHWKLIQWKNNGAVKGVDKCYDLNIYFLGLFFSYTNFDYNGEPSISFIRCYKPFLLLINFKNI